MEIVRTKIVGKVVGKPAIEVGKSARESSSVEMVGYGHTKTISWDEGQAINLKETTDTQLKQVLQHSGSKVIDTGVIACWMGARLLLSMFECQCCGQCCEGKIFAEPVLPLVPGEPRRIADYVGWSAKQFRQFCTHRSSALYLKLPCPFYREGSCSIYEVRPMSCQLYPLQGAIKVNGNTPTFAMDLDCPGGVELALKISKLRKALSQ